LKSKENILTHDLDSLTVECLPDQIPASVEVDLTPLTEVEQAIRVKDMVLDEGITVLNDPEHLVVKISVRRLEKVEEVEEIEEVAAEEGVEAPEGAKLPGEESKEE